MHSIELLINDRKYRACILYEGMRLLTKYLTFKMEMY